MNKIHYFTFMIVIVLFFNGCHHKEKADLILVNGLVYTTDSTFSIAEAFAVTNGLFEAVGTNDEVLGAFESAIIIDAGGKPVYPGLIDGHCHFYGYAVNRFQGISLRGTGSFQEILDLLKTFHDKSSASWVIGYGWDQNDWENKEFPDNEMLDKLFPQTPVVLTRIDGHAVLANSPALALAGFDPGVKIPGGKVLLRDGKMTGMLIDNAADKMKAVIPEPDIIAKSNSLEEAQNDCFRLGLTSVGDAGLDYEEVMLIDSLQQSGQLKLRINAMLSPSEKNLAEFVDRGPLQKERLAVNSVKLYADGALGSRGALLLEPYSDDPGNYGLQVSGTDYFLDIMQRAYTSGFQVNTHCIGDSANRLILGLYGTVLKGQNDRRWRIEHAQVVHPGDFYRFKEYNIIPSVQATHCTSDMAWAGDRLGSERIKGAYAYKELLQQNGWIINGTDFPIEEINPLLTFYAAVGRMDRNGHPEGGFQPENALNREDALRSMTIWAAKGSFEENFKGSIEAGKLADFVILDRDIMTVNVAEIPGTRVLKTYLNGELVYE